MIINLFINLIIGIIGIFFYLLPSVATLPFGIDTLLSNGMGYFAYIAQYIPPLQIMMNGFLILIGFKLSLKVVAMIPVVRGILFK